MPLETTSREEINIEEIKIFNIFPALLQSVREKAARRVLPPPKKIHQYSIRASIIRRIVAAQRAARVANAPRRHPVNSIKTSFLNNSAAERAWRTGSGLGRV